MKYILSDDNLELIANYILGNNSAFEKQTSEYQNLMLSYLNDNNSSTLRECITGYLLGYTLLPDKHGYDFWRETDKRSGEAKPKNYSLTGKRPVKNSGTGNFNDQTIQNVTKKLDDDIFVIVSFFAYNRLVYIIEFPYSTIYNSQMLKVKNTKKANQRTVCNFNYLDYIHDEKTDIKYLNWDIIKQYPHILNKKFMNILVEKSNDKSIYLS